MLSVRRRVCRPALALFVVLTLWPTFVLGQDKAGVVTTLEGNVTAARPAITQPVTLKFKDDVYQNDRITTGDRSLARMLLGGKAVVTVRERSVVTITESTGKSTIQLVTGKIGLAVAKERMGAGEQIEVKTPNAVAAVRGTVIVAEVERATAQAGGPGPAAVTHFWVLRGAIEAWQLAAGTGTPTGNSFQVNTLQGFTAAGNAPPTVGNIPPDQLGQITGGLTPQGQKEGGSSDQVVEQQVQTAVDLASIAGSGVFTETPRGPFGCQGACTPPRPPPTQTTEEEDETPSTPPSVSIPITRPVVLGRGAFHGRDPMLLVTDTNRFVPGDTVLTVQGAFTINSPGGALNVDATTVNADTLAHITGTLNMAAGGPVLKATDSLFVVTTVTEIAGTLNVGGARVDRALLDASAPVVWLIRSKMTVRNDGIYLVNNEGAGARLNANRIPGNVVFKLDASALRIANGSLASINNSVMLINGFLFALVNSSTLNIANGAFATVANGGVLNLTGSLGLLGAGTNTANIVTTPGAAGKIVTNIPNLVGVPVALINGATAAQVSVANGFQAFQGQGGSNAVSFGANAAALVVNGPAAKVNLKPAP